MTAGEYHAAVTRIRTWVTSATTKGTNIPVRYSFPLIRDHYQYSGGLCFEFDININILVTCVSNSRSISIFWWPLFRVRYRYQYFGGLSFEFNININIQVFHYFKFNIDIEIIPWWFSFQYWNQYMIWTNIGSISKRYRYFGRYLLSKNSAELTNLSTNIMVHAHFDINIDINLLVASVSNSKSISIFWWSQFRIRHQYQYSGCLSFEFEININILVASVSISISISIFWRPLFRNDIDTINILAIFPKSISISTSIRNISHRSGY